MTKLGDSNSTPRIRSDGFFISTLAVLGGTYVLLILLLLAGDLFYLLTTSSTTDVSITFDLDPSDPTAIDKLRDNLSTYGLNVSANRGLLLFDSTRPGDKSEWGTPHSDFGGPGTGAGSKTTGPIRNDERLSNLLTPGPIDATDAGELTFRWEQPLTMTNLKILAAYQPVIVEFLQGDQLVRKIETAKGRGPGSLQRVPLNAIKADTMKILLADGGGLAGLQFFWPGRLKYAWEFQFPWISAVLYNPITAALAKPEIRYSIALSLISCTITAVISLWISIPLGYLLSRFNFIGKGLVDAVLDIPIILPPLVVGLSLLILFQFAPLAVRDAVVYQIPAVILAQVAVACAFAVRTMKAAFDQIDPRCERVALTLGCSRATAFSRVVLPEALPGILTAGTLAWARALGEFGPLLIFAGATRFKTEVLSTSVFLELSVGDLSAAVAISMIMVIAAVVVLILTRIWGTKTISL